MKKSVVFTRERQVEVSEAPIPDPGPGELLVATVCSAISAGTELLAFRGQVPASDALDATLPALDSSFSYPFTYGYAAVGKVRKVGAGVDDSWVGRRVFSFHPHASHFVAAEDHVYPVPENVSSEQAVFIPTAETTMGLVHDGAPLVGERCLVLGQGVVGLMAAGILAKVPLVTVVTVDHWALRRRASKEIGAKAVLDASAAPEEIHRCLGGDGADLVYELTGQPEALDLAVACTGFEGRVVVGSWYGTRRASIDLGTHFHRGRLRIISSQVSHLKPELRGRWTKARRLEQAYRALALLQPERLITHRFPVEKAAEAYATLDQTPDRCLQVILTY